MMQTVNFKDYQKTRINLIEQLEAGNLDKTAFIKANHDLYKDQQVVIPPLIKSLDQGIFYYQYYNTMAKYHQLKYYELKYKDPFVAVTHRDQSQNHYQTKERITLQLLRDLVEEPIVAYFVKSQSKKLKHRLVEIVYPEHEKVILHSIDQQVIKLLKARRCLGRGVKASLIDGYINTPYDGSK